MTLRIAFTPPIVVAIGKFNFLNGIALQCYVRYPVVAVIVFRKRLGCIPRYKNLKIGCASEVQKKFTFFVLLSVCTIFTTINPLEKHS